MVKKKTGLKGSTKKKSAAEIAEAAMPGWKAVPEEEQIRVFDAGVSSSPDATLPSLTDLRKKYLGEEVARADFAPEHTAATDDTEVVTMTSGPLKKKVGVKGGKIIWYQG